jgi:hypothetical protein
MFEQYERAARLGASDADFAELVQTVYGPFGDGTQRRAFSRLGVAR